MESEYKQVSRASPQAPLASCPGHNEVIISLANPGLSSAEIPNQVEQNVHPVERVLVTRDCITKLLYSRSKPPFFGILSLRVRQPSGHHKDPSPCVAVARKIWRVQSQMR